jgi:lipopolysaccharide transport system ATP-binding protein
MSKAITVENLSKIYRLGEIGTGTMAQDIDRWFKTKVMGKEDPFLKIGENNDRSKKGNGDIVYSLQDINFEINQGDAVGIIGRNGAGKSTLLKILSRVTTPTKGKINIKGRMASLLEVGTGFHPELTGRENIYLNGAILGMRKREIDRKIEEIIDFSGVERYIDTPVKRYSSGMYVRLAFAVAAHLESEILVVDEVLAVGDAEFQKKCLGKMGEVSKGEGRTILFVSHNLESIKSLCDFGINLNCGKLDFLGSATSAVDRYLNLNSNLETTFQAIEKKTNTAVAINFVGVFPNNLNSTIFLINEEIKIKIGYFVDTQKPILVSTSVHVKSNNVTVFVFGDSPTIQGAGEYEVIYTIPRFILNNILYSLDVKVMSNVNNVEDELFEIVNFKLEESQRDIEYIGEIGGLVRPQVLFTEPLQKLKP